jgi:hypothetical protein
MRKNIETLYMIGGLGWGGTGHGWLCHFIIIMFGTIECCMEWPELD